MSASSKKRTVSKSIFRLTPLLAITSIVLLAFALLTQIGDLDASLRAIRSADIGLLIMAAGFVFGTYFAAAFALSRIAFYHLSYKKILIVQLASGFATKLVPAGIGGFALNLRFLMRHRHTTEQAGAVMLMNGLLGVLGHLTIIGLVILLTEGLTGRELDWSFSLNMSGTVRLVLSLGLIALLSTFLAIRSFRRKFTGLLTRIKTVFISYRRRPTSLLWGYFGGLGVTILFTSALFLSARALGVHLNVIETLFVFTLGMIGSTVTPTPGGIGGAEASLAAALTLIGVERNLAISVAIMYRLLSYWLPILPGFVVFHVLLRKNYI